MMKLSILLLLGFTTIEVVKAQCEQKVCPTNENGITWELINPETNDTCFLMTGYFELIIPYITNDMKTAYAKLQVYCNATIEGSCMNNNGILDASLNWDNNILNFEFIRNAALVDEPDSGFFELSKISAKILLTPEHFNDAIDQNKEYTLFGNGLEAMSAPLQLSFYCASRQILKFDNNNGELYTHNVQVEAFKRPNMLPIFGPRSNCIIDVVKMLIQAVIYLTLVVAVVLLILYFYKRKTRRQYRNI